MKELEDYIEYLKSSDLFLATNVDKVECLQRAIEKRLDALEETVAVETKDSYNHYADSFGEVEQQFTALESANEILKRNIEELMYHHHQGDSEPRWSVEEAANAPKMPRPLPCCETCLHGLALDEYTDILCLRASVWQAARFEHKGGVDCDYHVEREA